MWKGLLLIFSLVIDLRNSSCLIAFGVRRHSVATGKPCSPLPKGWFSVSVRVFANDYAEVNLNGEIFKSPYETRTIGTLQPIAGVILCKDKIRFRNLQVE